MLFTPMTIVVLSTAARNQASQRTSESIGGQPSAAPLLLVSPEMDVSKTGWAL